MTVGLGRTGQRVGQGLGRAGGAPSPAWTPAALGAAVVGWHDAQDIATLTLNAGSVASWANKGSAGGAATQTTAAAQPAWSATGWDGTLPACVWAAGKDLDLPSGELISGSGARYVFVAAGQTGTATNAYVLGGPGGNGATWALGYDGYPARAAYVDAGAGDVTGTKISGGAWAAQTLVGFGYAGGSGGAITFHRNGTLVSPGGRTATLATSSGGGKLGRWPLFGNAWSGPIGEVIIVGRDLSGDERRKLEGYAAWRWNRVADLPSDHPYKSARP